MPRRLLLDGAIVDDEWKDFDAQSTDSSARGRLIVPFERFRSEPEAWANTELGIELAPTHAVEDVVPFLGKLSLIACNFPGPGEGRGYTQGRLLRERYCFTRELRATGYVRRDQVFLMARCGFNAFVLPDEELEAAQRALATFTGAYQRSNDRGLERPLLQR